MIKAKNLIHHYGSVVAVDGVSFEVPKGQVVGLVGPNGAGKTTTMKILTGYLAPTGGGVEIAGHDMVSDRLEAQAHLGYLPESAPIYREMSVQDYLVFMAKMRGVEAPQRRARLSAVVSAFGLGSKLKSQVGHLSKGFRQRVGLAQALVHDPQILVLDEPTSGLDPTQILEIRETLRGLGEDKTVILSTHILSEVESTCDRIVMIVSGRIHLDQDVEAYRRGSSVLLAVMDAPEAAREELAKIDGVSSIDSLESRSGAKRFRLHIEGGRDLLAEIGRAVKQAGWTVAELTREHRDLEDVFRALKDEKGQSGGQAA